MTDRNHLPPPEVLRQIGEQLRLELRAAGIEPPSDVTPEQIAESIFDYMRAELDETPPGEFQELCAKVRAELGPEASREQFGAVLAGRLAEARRRRRSSEPGASA